MTRLRQDSHRRQGSGGQVGGQADTPGDLERTRQAVQKLHRDNGVTAPDDEWADAIIHVALEALMEPSEGAWEAWRSVNCRHGTDGMEEFTYFKGDFGNWLSCHQAMLRRILEQGK